MNEPIDDFRVPGPTVLYVDALGYVWQPGALEGHISMARTTQRNLPSPDLITYTPIPAGAVVLTREHVDRVLEWSTPAGDVWGSEWNSQDESIVRHLECGEQ